MMIPKQAHVESSLCHSRCSDRLVLKQVKYTHPCPQKSISLASSVRMVREMTVCSWVALLELRVPRTV